MKPIDNFRNPIAPQNDSGPEVSQCSKWPGPDFDAGKKVLLKETDASQPHSEMASSMAENAKSALNTEADLRRFTIEQDLNQSDMGKKKENQSCIKQQILEYPSGHY